MNKSQVFERMAQLGPTNGKPPERHTWDRHRYEIRRHCNKGDDLDKFLQWSTLTETMFVGAAPYIAYEFGVLCGSGEWQRWREAIRETEFGGATHLPYANCTSGNLVHQAYHLYKWEKATGLRIENLSRIVEFGGGYGAMALIARRLGFKGTYYIFDVPEVSLLQEWYLSNVGVTDVILCPCNEPEQYEPPRYVDLLIACWSLSETPTETRNLFLDAINPFSLLIAYQSQWRGQNNIQWLSDIKNTTYSDYTWIDAEACRDSFYLFGRMNDA